MIGSNIKCKCGKIFKKSTRYETQCLDCWKKHHGHKWTRRT